MENLRYPRIIIKYSLIGPLKHKMSASVSQSDAHLTNDQEVLGSISLPSPATFFVKIDHEINIF